LYHPHKLENANYKFVDSKLAWLFELLSSLLAAGVSGVRDSKEISLWFGDPRVFKPNTLGHSGANLIKENRKTNLKQNKLKKIGI